MQTNERIQKIISLLPADIAKAIINIPVSKQDVIREIRLRAGKPLLINITGVEYSAGIAVGTRSPLIVTEADCRNILNRIAEYSLYSIEDCLKRGFVTIMGGCRIGICGEAINENNVMKLQKNCMYFNIRIPHQIRDAADRVMPYIASRNGVRSALIISPPGMGKTTMLREIIRNCSEAGYNVSVVDERSELAGSSKGVWQFDLGIRTDVSDGALKAEGIELMLRSMSPDVLVTDEIGRVEDAAAVMDALSAGVAVITSVHGNSIEHIRARTNIRPLLEDGIFDRYIILGNGRDVGTVDKILDARFDAVYSGENKCLIS